jgi:hypothetical protein
MINKFKQVDLGKSILIHDKLKVICYKTTKAQANLIFSVVGISSISSFGDMGTGRVSATNWKMA